MVCWSIPSIIFLIPIPSYNVVIIEHTETIRNNGYFPMNASSIMCHISHSHMCVTFLSYTLPMVWFSVTLIIILKSDAICDIQAWVLVDTCSLHGLIWDSCTDGSSQENYMHLYLSILFECRGTPFFLVCDNNCTIECPYWMCLSLSPCLSPSLVSLYLADKIINCTVSEHYCSTCHTTVLTK